MLHHCTFISFFHFGEPYYYFSCVFFLVDLYVMLLYFIALYSILLECIFLLSVF